jgi:GH25 family lysozyme M1 (1,4-beta-N-acetylmuramidase)
MVTRAVRFSSRHQTDRLEVITKQSFEVAREVNAAHSNKLCSKRYIIEGRHFMRGAKHEQPTGQDTGTNTDPGTDGSRAAVEAQELARRHAEELAKRNAHGTRTQIAPHATQDAMTKFPPGAVGLPFGIDVYHGDNIGSLPDWNKVKAAGATFSFAKAIEGITVLDAKFQDNFSGAKKAGLVTGAYDFYNPQDDGAAQAKAFLKTLPALRKGDLVALDLEGDKWKQVPQADRIKGVLAWLNTVEKELNITPIVYMSRGFVSETFGADADKLKNYPLWEAEYKVDRPTVPPPFTKPYMWQFTETEKNFPGLAGNSDVNVYMGDVPLQKLSTSLRVNASRNIYHRAIEAKKQPPS